MDKIPLSLLTSKLSNTRSFSLSSCDRCSNPLITFMAVCWTRSSMSISFLYWKAHYGPSTPDVSHQCWIKGKDQLLWLAGNTLSNTAQGAICLICLKSTLLAHVKRAVNQDHQGLFCRADFQPVMPQAVLVHAVIPPRGGRTLPFPLLNFIRYLLAHFSTHFFTLSEWQHAHLVYPLLPVLQHLQTCWVYTLSHHLGN